MGQTSLERHWRAPPPPAPPATLDLRVAPRTGRIASRIERIVGRIADALGGKAAVLARVRDRQCEIAASVGCADASAAGLLARSALHLAATPRSPDWVASPDGAEPMLTLPLSPAPGVRLLVVVSNPAQDLPPGTLAASAGWIDDSIGLWWQVEQGEARCAGLRAAFSMLDVGGILLDAQGNILETNDAAAAILSCGDGLTRDRTRIAASNADDNDLLREAVLRVIVAGHGDVVPPPQHLILRRTGDAKPLGVAVLRPASGIASVENDPSVLLLIADPDAAPRSITSACQMYGLSRNESRLAQHLVAGLTIDEIAGKMAVKPDSIRTYLKHIFAKTGVARQSNLVRLLMMSRLPVDSVRLLPRRAAAVSRGRPVPEHACG